MTGTRVALTAMNEPAVAAGARVAAAGGNAVDAALATCLVCMVCEPGVVALAGGAFVTVDPGDGSDPVVVDGYVEMPGRGLPADRVGRGSFDVDCDYGGGITMTVGHGSVATPGALAAFGLAHRRYGRAPWREVVQPAVEAAREGFPLGRTAHYYLRYVHDSVFGWHPDSRAALHDERGRLIDLGERVHVPFLADSLELVAEQGAHVLYAGELARLIAADMAANDGLLTAADLAAYRPIVRPALAVALGPWRLATNPAPAIGGVALAAMLLLLGKCPEGPWSSADLARLAAVQHAVLGYRTRTLDLDADRVAAADRLLAMAGERDLRALRSVPGTAHVSAVDGDGVACAVTASAGYGSGVMTPGTGIWLNNCLGEQELNRRGLAALRPGDRLPSNMAPTVGRRADGALLAAGSPGADRITTALAQVLAGVANGGLTLRAAIEHPRLHVRVRDEGVLVDHEADLALPELSWPTRVHEPRSMYFGGVGVAVRHPDGRLDAAADPRRVSAVAVTDGR